jgi:hypothetical protein
VQQIAHSVIGAPAPDSAVGRTDAGPAKPGQVLAPLPSSSTATADPSSGATPGSTPGSTAGSTPGSTPGTAPGSAPGSGSTQLPQASSSPGGAGPTSGPTGDPSSTTTPPTATADTPGGLTAAGATHRVGVGQAITLSSILTAADGSALPDHPVVLQVRGPHQWRRVVETTTDAAGTATAVTPPLTRSALFRWHTDHRIHSTHWLVRVVPTVSATAEVGGATTVITGTTQGGRPGDHVQLLRRADHRVSLVRRGVLDANGAVSFPIATPPRRGVFAVRLLSTRAHTAARGRVRVVPPAAASVALAVPSRRVPVGGSLTVSGVVRAADGSALPGRPVRLQVRGPRRWVGVGSATTDADGSVALATPAARRTVRYRLRAGDGVHSSPVRVAMVPALSATMRSDGADADIVGTALGGHAGDRVVLLRRLGGRLVKIQHAPLADDGTVSFRVVRRARSTTYVVRLLATRRHAAATAKATVAGTG